ncbi:unnamed protein product, partial [Pylaiella littoralis]
MPAPPVPWVEKYRPRRIGDVVRDDKEDAVGVLRGSARTGDLPNLLFHGPPGTGKTSTILVLARGLFGQLAAEWTERVLEVNASDEIVHDRIANFSKTLSRTMSKTMSKTIKLVILDEADTMTPAAQASLRRTMETHSASTRFCLVCNCASGIIDSLASRCLPFRFRPLGPGPMKGRLLRICETEGVIFEEDSRGALDQIVASSAGDMRRAVNLLQTASQLPRACPASIADAAGEVPAAAFDELWSTACSGSASVDGVAAAVLRFVGEGYAVGRVLGRFQEMAVSSSTMADAAKAVVCGKVMEVSRCLNDGADEEVQLLDLCLVL